MKLKVCGMKYRDNIEALSWLQPDYMGFIFYDKSSRYFDGQIPSVSKSIKKTGVFVNEEMDLVIDLIKKHELQAVQLHGEESAEFCKKLKISILEHCHTERSRSAIELIKVFSIKDHFNFEAIQPYEGIVDYFLFDTKGQLPGGNGFTFDWKVLNDYPSKTPYFLSGGIGLETTNKLKEFQNSPASKYCYAIDVNSKFEIEPGLKHIEELEKFKHDIQH
ncbi:phosphoribosylanthranilate isomerase [Winogradskyella maritima]|uniref:N-(5'-phosphoribosyl)anthranilate isomerase n=1 Tax=Winogradskyella maritima TaxID=1517766 RepID=A0ABV8AG37_9FLAO|nr:phosphoribosylanthranilate isomerase [Winogradskyella maritima]